MPQGNQLKKTAMHNKSKRGSITKEIQKNKHKPKPRKRTKETKAHKKLQGGHTALTESILADRVKSQNQKLRIIAPDQKLIKGLKVKETRRKEKYG